MMDATPSPSDYDGHKDVLRAYIERQTELIDMALHALTTGEGIERLDVFESEKDVVDTIWMMTQSMGASCHSILKLTAELDMSIRDSLGIARSIVEIGVNIAYILAGGTEIAQRAQRHAMQKTFRDLARQGSVGSIGFELSRTDPLPDPKKIPELEAALEEFTSSKGHEVRDWTADNLDKRIKLISEKFGKSGIGFAGATIAVFRHGSEILHGTYFGVVHFWTAGMTRVTTKSEAEYLILSHLISTVTAVFFTVNGVVDVIDKKYKIPHLSEANKAVFKFFSSYLTESLAHIASPPSEENSSPAASN